MTGTEIVYKQTIFVCYKKIKNNKKPTNKQTNQPTSKQHTIKTFSNFDEPFRSLTSETKGLQIW